MKPKYYSEEEILKRAECADALLIVKSVLEDTPPAEVAALRHATWIRDRSYPSKSKIVYRCSLCDHWEAMKKDRHPARVNHLNFCPCCGARMDLFETLVESHGFGKKVIRLAQEKSIEKFTTPSVKYMNALLKHWQSIGLRTYEDVVKYVRSSSDGEGDGNDS